MSAPEANSDAQSEPFSAHGTLLTLGINSLQGPAEGLPADRLLDLMDRHLDHAMSAIAKHKRIIHRFIGDAIEAYWLDGDKPSGRAAFACAVELLAEPMPRNVPKHVHYDLDITLATGELVGARFGPIQQFQIIGSARTISDRLSGCIERGNGLRACNYTFAALEVSELLEPIATVNRGELAPLVVYRLKAGPAPKKASRWPWR